LKENIYTTACEAIEVGSSVKFCAIIQIHGRLIKHFYFEKILNCVLNALLILPKQKEPSSVANLKRNQATETGELIIVIPVIVILFYLVHSYSSTVGA
jgi:hypothetical protein